MGIESTTKDTTALSDAELEELADLCGAAPRGFDLGFLSKEASEWVLVAETRLDQRLVGFSFSTLERIGGTPSLLVGLAGFQSGPDAERVLHATLVEQFRRALLAFPDEDVLFGTRLVSVAGFRAFEGLSEIVPRPGHRATGEERAWGRRLAKRFGAEGRLDDRRFVLAGNGLPVPALVYDGPAPRQAEEIELLFSDLDAERGDSVVAFGWAMAEDLLAGALPR